MKRNVILFLISLITSILLGSFFGELISPYLFYGNGGFATFSFPDDLSNFINGFPFLYVLLVPLLFGIWGVGRKYIWEIILITPIILVFLYIEVGKNIWIWSAIFFLLGFAISKLIRFGIPKYKNPTQNTGVMMK